MHPIIEANQVVAPMESSYDPRFEIQASKSPELLRQSLSASRCFRSRPAVEWSEL